MKQNKYSIFHIEGGLGKHVAATAVARAIKKNHPERDLIVVCAYPEIFINLDFISRVYISNKCCIFNKQLFGVYQGVIRLVYS
jgi:hypothetical protein